MAVAGQFGLKSETTWGTNVTPDTFHQGWLSGMPTRDQPPLVSKGIRTGRRTPTCLSTGPKIVEGTVSTELVPAPMATLLRHMFGTINTTGAGPYVHTASPGPLNGKSFTAQFGVSGNGGTTHPFTFYGCKLPSWSLKGKAGELATLDLDISAKDYTTATALATASYGSGCPFTFAQGSVSVGGSTLSTVHSFDLKADRPLRTGKDGIFIGSTLIGEQLETGPAEFRITVESEFDDLTLHALANSAVAVVLTFTNGTDTLAVTSNSWIEAFTPGAEATDSLNSSSFDAICYGTTDAAAVTAVLTNTESSSA